MNSHAHLAGRMLNSYLLQWLAWLLVLNFLAAKLMQKRVVNKMINSRLSTIKLMATLCRLQPDWPQYVNILLQILAMLGSGFIWAIYYLFSIVQKRLLLPIARC